MIHRPGRGGRANGKFNRRVPRDVWTESGGEGEGGEDEDDEGVDSDGDCVFPRPLCFALILFLIRGMGDQDGHHHQSGADGPRLQYDRQSSRVLARARGFTCDNHPLRGGLTLLLLQSLITLAVTLQVAISFSPVHSFNGSSRVLFRFCLNVIAFGTSIPPLSLHH